MSNNHNVPDGWAMPDALTKKVSEALNRKSITPEQELQDALDDMARDIALIEPNPVGWGGWVIYLLEQILAEAYWRGKQGEFNEMLNSSGKEHN